MKMEEKAENSNLPNALSESIQRESVSLVAELAEVGIDNIIEDGILKEIPILSTVISVYKIGSSLRERHHLKKLVVFLDEINRGIADEKIRQDYVSKIKDDAQKRTEELEYILLMLDRYIHYEKANNIAKLYLAYLQGELSWLAFSPYADLLDKLLPGDIEYLSDNIVENYGRDEEWDCYIQRLEALGLVAPDKEKRRPPLFSIAGEPIPISTEGPYRITSFGAVFERILNDKR